MCLKSLKPFKDEVKDLVFKKFLTGYYYRLKWEKYEQVLMIRTMMHMFSRVALGVTYLL